MTTEELVLLDCEIEETQSQIAEMEMAIHDSQCSCKDALSRISGLQNTLQSLINQRLDFEMIYGEATLKDI